MKIIEKIENNIVSYFGIIALIGLFNSLPFVIYKYHFIRNISVVSLIFKAIYLYVTVTLFFVGVFGICVLISSKLAKYIIYFIGVISALLFFIDISLLINFRTLINRQTIQILFESNRAESIEFLKQYFDIRIVIICIVVILLMCLSKFIVIRFNLKVLKVILFLSIIQLIIYKPIFRAIPFTRLFFSLQNSYRNIKVYNNIANKISNDVNITEINNKLIDNVVIIIGESTSRNHMNLYGYVQENNPLLKSRNLYKYTDIISPHSHTLAVLKKVLTFYNTESDKEWFEYSNIIDIMQKAGYETYWISNQETMGDTGNIAAALGRRSKNVIFNEIRDTSEIQNKFDYDIVKKSQSFVDFKSKNFIVYHLLGTHYLYKYRYPKEFSKFSPENYSDGLEKNKRQYIAEYDNAVLYNDYVINEIIKMYENKESIVIYFSDHGEEVNDFRDFIGHTESNLSRYMIEIPFIIYTSDKFIQNYPQKVEQIKKSLNRPYMTDDVIHTILDIADIKTIEFDETRSIINDKFVPRDRIIQDKSYDNYWKNLN